MRQQEPTASAGNPLAHRRQTDTQNGAVMAPIMAAVVFLAAMAAANGFVAPLAGRHHAPLARSDAQAALQMSTGGGDDKPLVFPRCATGVFCEATTAAFIRCCDRLGIGGSCGELYSPAV